MDNVDIRKLQRALPSLVVELQRHMIDCALQSLLDGDVPVEWASPEVTVVCLPHGDHEVPFRVTLTVSTDLGVLPVPDTRRPH